MVHNELDWKWCTMNWTGGDAQWSGLEMMHNEAETASLGVYFARENGDIMTCRHMTENGDIWRVWRVAGPWILTPCQPHSVTSEWDRTWFRTGFWDTNRPRRFNHHKKYFAREGRGVAAISGSEAIEAYQLSETSYTRRRLLPKALVLLIVLYMSSYRWVHFSRAVLVERKTGGFACLIIILYEQDIWLRSYRKCNNVAKDGWNWSSRDYTIRAGFSSAGPPETCVARRKWRNDSEERRRRKKKRKKKRKKEVEWIGNV